MSTPIAIALTRSSTGCSSGPRSRRAFNLIELMIALAITAVLLTATLVALNASFMAYQSTTEQASTHTIGRLVIHRMLALIRTGQDFGPFPINPQDSIVTSDFVEIVNPAGQLVTLRFDADAEALFVRVGADDEVLLLEGIQPRVDEDGEPIPPFTLEYKLGRKLYRATIDLTIVPDDNMSVQLDGENNASIRLVASAMPRNVAY